MNKFNSAVSFTLFQRWFYQYFYTNLNGVYRPGGKVEKSATGIHWGVKNDFSSYDESLVFIEMKMRRNL